MVRFLLVIIALLPAYMNAGIPQDFFRGPMDYDIMPGLKQDPEEDTETPAATVESDFWDVNDSLMNIPAYDRYCKWDTKVVHAYGFDLTRMRDTAHIKLRHEACDYAHPCHGEITSDFGERGSRYHYGIDLKLSIGDPVFCAFEGLVRIAQYSSTYGNVVVVRHNNGLETFYAHLDKMHVAPGDYVEAGQEIGLGGNTGRSYGAHLHFECRYLGEPIDPKSIIDFNSGDLVANSKTITSADFKYLEEIRSAKYHHIRSGDTLTEIAQKYGTSVSTLCQLNGISRNTVLRIGRTIRYR